MRAVRAAPSLRDGVVLRVVTRELRGASRAGLRVVHFSVQRDHVHMIVEATDARSLSRGLQRFESRVAMEINRIAGRSGRLWRERYHRRDLTSPRQVRHALVHMLMNVRKPTGNALLAPDDRPPTVAPRTWLAATGWHTRGRLGFDEFPRGPS